MPEHTLKTAGTLSARASKSLDAMRTHVTRALRAAFRRRAPGTRRQRRRRRHDCSRPLGSADL